MKGQTYKRCKCPPSSLLDETGRRVTCSKKHGTWYSDMTCSLVQMAAAAK